jgi:hypothetical protein
MGLRPTQGDEKRLLFSNYSHWKDRPPLCHLDRSVAQWRDLRFSGPFLEMFFDRVKRSGIVSLCRSLISGGQHCLKKGRLGFFMHHGGVHISESGFAQKQLQFHFTEA